MASAPGLRARSGSHVPVGRSLRHKCCDTKASRPISSVTVTESIDYPQKHKFGLHSVLANKLERLTMLQRLRSTHLSKLLTSYFVNLQRSPTRKVIEPLLRSFARSVLQVLRLLVLLIAPLSDCPQTFHCGLVLFAPCNRHEDSIKTIAVVGADETSTCSTAGGSRVTASLRRYEEAVPIWSGIHECIGLGGHRRRPKAQWAARSTP